jgi:transcriptional regulator of arginine metabolism
MTTKVQRQQSITRLISERDVTSQPQLLRLLKKSGIAATQATVSRDLEDLGAVKVRTAKGDTAYAIPEFEPERIAPLEQLRRVLSEWVADIQVSHPLVIASALDRSRIEGLVGTVAGDDTMFCVASEKFGAKKLAAHLGKLAGLQTTGAVKK